MERVREDLGTCSSFTEVLAPLDVRRVGELRGEKVGRDSE